MEITPDLEGFRVLAHDRRVISVYARVSADDVTPVGLFAQLCGDRPNTFLFESAEKGVWGRWSFIGVNSRSVLVGDQSQAHWQGESVVGLPMAGETLNVLGETLAALRAPRDPDLPPFTSGMVGYLGYDMVRHVEHLPNVPTDDLELPEMVMMLAGDLAVLDHHRGEVWLIANAINFDGGPDGVDQAYEDACDRVRAMADQLAGPRPSLTSVTAEPAELAVSRQFTSDDFETVVSQAKERIFAGDIFQVVPSQRFDIETSASALAIYRQLRATNPSPYLFLLRFEVNDNKFQVVGSSPEALVTVRDQVATMHPIAGTRPRGASAAQEAALEKDLLADEKERAEHLMLVDLGRNDLGRVCEPGSVVVTEFMGVHRYSTVMHLEATVVGTVREGVDALGVTMACFPAGTLSGAPKVSAMRIIDSLERSKRGIYGGVVGYFDFAGDSDVAIAIRMAVLADGVAHVQAGAGVVADSVPANEDREAWTKARTVMLAIERAEAMTPLGAPIQTREP